MELPYSGHLSTIYLSELGILKQAALQVMEGKRIETNLMENRRSSTQWLYEVAKTLYSQSRFVQSLLCIDKAMLLRSSDLTMMRFRLNVLVKLERFKDALVQGELILAAGDATFERYFKWLQEKNTVAK